ncbi:MAG: alpha/beta hydrolase [Clostridia bacterium]
MKKKAIIAICLLVFVFLILPMTVTIVTYKYHFGSRVSHDNNYFEYITEKNTSFVKEDVSFQSNEGQILRGGIYTQVENDDPRGFIIFVHGNKLSHEEYLAEIEWLTLENYVVFSYDNTGTQSSDGDSLKGLTQAVIDLSHALEYVKGMYDLPYILIGHSWGGFAVSSVYEYGVSYDVDAIVSLAGFYKNINIVIDIAKLYVGDVVQILRPYLEVYEWYLFAENSNLDGIDGLKNTTAKVLMIHSEDDHIVGYNNNFLVYKNAFENDDRFTFISYEDAGHRLTITGEAYDNIHDIMHHQLEYEAGSERYLELREERNSMIYEFNEDILADILDFCNEITE